MVFSLDNKGEIEKYLFSIELIKLTKSKQSDSSYVLRYNDYNKKNPTIYLLEKFVFPETVDLITLHQSVIEALHLVFNKIDK